MSRHHPTTTLNDLNEDLWMNILQFMTLDDLLHSAPPQPTTTISTTTAASTMLIPKLFCISPDVFSTLIGVEISQFNTSKNDDGGDGGLFYRVLTEKLIATQLDHVVERIKGRQMWVYTSGDYDEKINEHDTSLLKSERKIYFTRSRLNVDPCGRSMSFLRGELKRLSEICYSQFPHIYSRNTNRIEEALRRSIKICTPVTKPKRSDMDIEYVENTDKKPLKPLFWDDKRREESIKQKFQKNVKKVAWRKQWIHLYRNYLLSELEFHLKNCSTQIRVSKIACTHPEEFIETINRIHNLLSKFGEEFRTRFYTERKFVFEKKEYYYRHMRVVVPIGATDFDFNTSMVQGLVRIYRRCKSLSEISPDLKEQFRNQIDKHMTLYAKYFERNLFKKCWREFTIYHYLIKSGESDLVDKHFTNRSQELLNVPDLHQSFLTIFVGHTGAMPSIVKSLSFSLGYDVINESGMNEPETLTNVLLDTTLADDKFSEWIQLLVDRFGQLQVALSISSFQIHSLLEADIDDAIYNRLEILKSMLGNDFTERTEEIKHIFGVYE